MTTWCTRIVFASLCVSITATKNDDDDVMTLQAGEWRSGDAAAGRREEAFPVGRLSGRAGPGYTRTPGSLYRPLYKVSTTASTTNKSDIAYQL